MNATWNMDETNVVLNANGKITVTTISGMSEVALRSLIDASYENARCGWSKPGERDLAIRAQAELIRRRSRQAVSFNAPAADYLNIHAYWR